MAKAKPTSSLPLTDAQNAERLRLEDETEAIVGSPEITMKRLEEMERRLAEKEASLDMRQNMLQEMQQTQNATLADRIAELTAASTGSAPLRRDGGSGKVITVNKGDWIGYDTRLGRGTNIQGGWVKCSEDDSVNSEVNNIGIARGSFTYDPLYGMPYHQVVMSTSIGVQIVKKWFKGKGEVRMSPPHLLEPLQNSNQPNLGAVGI